MLSQVCLRLVSLLYVDENMSSADVIEVRASWIMNYPPRFFKILKIFWQMCQDWSADGARSLSPSAV